MEKSYNQRYKEANTTLSYKEWRKREDEKMASFDGIPNISDTTEYKKTVEKMQSVGGLQTKLKGKSVFGISYNILAISGIIILGVVAYKIYKKNK